MKMGVLKKLSPALLVGGGGQNKILRGRWGEKTYLWVSKCFNIPKIKRGRTP